MAKKEIDISIGIDALIENGFFYLEKHQWKRAKEYFEKAIEISPRNPYPYIGKLLVTHKLPTMDSLPECPIDFRNTNNYKTALRYADDSLKLKFDSYVAQYEKNLDEKYQTMCSEFSIANSLEDYNRCYKAFVDFGDYKDSIELAQKAKEFIAQHNYEIYVKKVDNNLSEDECLQIYHDLLSMNYKESKRYAALYREKYEKIKCEKEKESIYLSALSRMRNAESGEDYIEIKKVLEPITGYKDSNLWIKKCDDKIKKNKIGNIAMLTITAILFVLSIIITPENIRMFVICGELAGMFVGFIIGKIEGRLCYYVLVFFVIGLGIGLVFMLIEAWIPEYDTGDACGVCGGSGVFRNKVCPSCGGWGTKD